MLPSFHSLHFGLGILIILWLLLGFTKLGIFKSLSLVTMFLLMLWLSIQVANKPFIAMDAAQILNLVQQLKLLPSCRFLGYQ